MNKLVEIKDLQIDDEIIISSNSKLKYLKILKLPEYHPNLNWRGQPYYKSVRCSIRQDSKIRQHWNNTDYVSKNYVFETDITKHNRKISLDLNDRDIWLVKRPEQQTIFNK